MKKSFALFFVFSLFLLSSCNSDNNLKKDKNINIATGNTSTGSDSEEVDEAMKEIDKIINDIGTGTTK